MASLSDVGRERSENQDACGEFGDRFGYRCLVVADGMGGHRGGATASRLFVETIGETFDSRAETPEPPIARLERAFARANQRIHEAAQGDPELAGMGTTAVVLVFGPEDCGWVAHVGDSRLYRWRGGHLERMTEDHSVVGEMQRQGILSAAEAESHPRRNELLRSVGVLPDVQVETAALRLEPGDRWLTCSDGLSGVVSDEEIERVVGRAGAEDVARCLVDLANERGGPDNVTVQVAVAPKRAAAAAEPPAPDRSKVVRLAGAALVVGIAVLAGLIWLALGDSAPSPEPAERRPLASPRPPEPPPEAPGGTGLPVVEPAESFELPDVLGPDASSAEHAGLPERTTDSRSLSAPAPFAAESSARAPAPRPPAQAATRREPAPAVVAAAPEPVPATEAEPEPMPEPEIAPAAQPAVEPAAEAEAEPPAAREPAPPPVEVPPLEVAAREATARAGALDVAAAAGRARGPDGAEAVERFLRDWERAVETADFELYRKLGFPQSRREFERSYGALSDVDLSLRLLAREPSGPGLRLRLQRTYVYRDRTGARRIDGEIEVPVVETADGLRYDARAP